MLGTKLGPKLGTVLKTVFKQNSDKHPSHRGRLFFTRLTIAMVAVLSSSVNAELILNGSTIYSDLGKDQFVAALYIETAHNNPQVIQTMDSNKRMEVRMLNNYSKRRWVNLWMQSISINNSRENFSDSAEELIALMQAPKSAPKKGDVLEYIFSPQQGTSMRFNGTELISDLSGDVFGLLLRTWIGAIPPSTSFKEQLLGNQSNREARDMLESLSPDKERVALAASWMIPQPKPQPKKEPKQAAAIAPKVAAPTPIAEPAAKPVAEVKIAKAENPSTDAPKEVASEETASEELAISENTTA